MRKELALIDAISGELVVGRVRVAGSFLARAKGLIGKAHLAPHEGMWFDRCDSIHTMFMRVPIDVLFLDRDGCVLRAVSAAAPWRPYIGFPGAASVLELAAGTIERTGVIPGDVLVLR